MFLLLNLLLGYQLWNDRFGLSADTPEAAREEQALVQVLEMKNIGIMIELPTETPKLRELTMNVTPPGGIPQRQELSKPFEISLLTDRERLSAMLSGPVPDGENYRLSPVDSRNSSYVMHQMLDGRPLFDVTLELLSSEGRVIAYRQLHAEPLAGATHQEQKVLSAHQAVSILAEQYLQENANIIDVQLGYHGQAFNSETRVLAPYWRVITEAGEQFFVHAITGAVE